MEMLSVDDDRSVHYLLEVAIQQIETDISLHSVYSGDEALAFLRRVGGYADAPRPAMVLLDINMPRLTGFEVLEVIQNEPPLKTIPVIMFSSSSLDSDRRRAFALGAASYITKPKDFQGFIDALITICGFA